MLGTTTNQLLRKTEEATAKTVPAEMKGAFEKIVMAGLKVMHDPKTHDMTTKQLTKEGDPVHNAAEGTASLLAILYKESKGTMSMKAGIPAAQVLLCEALSFMEETKIIPQVTNDMVATATKDMMAYILQLFGVSKDQIAKYMQAGAQAVKQPQQPALLKPQPTGLIGAR